MPVENDFLPYAAEPGANVITQGAYAGSGFQENGQQPGIVLSDQWNKAVRQGSLGMAVIAAFIAQILNENVLDSGYGSAAAEVAALLAQFEAALTAYISAGAAAPPRVFTVAYSATPVFPLGQPPSSLNQLHPVFEITLTGNVTSSTFTGATQAGQIVTFHILQDGTGGHTFAPPASLPMDAIDGTPNQVNSQSFYVLADGSMLPMGPMTLKI